jgi:large subunit ribosomal protein L9
MALVKLILQEEVHGLGDAGEVVTVKPGYARNYLVPQGKASQASAAKIQELEHHKRQIAEKVAKQLKDLKKTKAQLEKLSLEIKAKAGEEGKLFGSVTPAQVAGLLAEKGFEIDRRKLGMTEPLKELGEHSVELRLQSGVTATLKIVVAADDAE